MPGGEFPALLESLKDEFALAANATINPGLRKTLILALLCQKVDIMPSKIELKA